LRIVGSQTKVEKVFNIASICTNLRCFQLDMDNFEILINNYKNWSNDAHVGEFPFMEMEETLMKENEDVIASFGLLDLKDSNNRL